jgi:hypothetical protein
MVLILWHMVVYWSRYGALKKGQEKIVNFLKKNCDWRDWRKGWGWQWLMAVILVSMESADQGGSNSGRIVAYGCVLIEIWCFEKRSRKNCKFFEKKLWLAWLEEGVRLAVADGSDFGINGKRRSRRFEWW